MYCYQTCIETYKTIKKRKENGLLFTRTKNQLNGR